MNSIYICCQFAKNWQIKNGKNKTSKPLTVSNPPHTQTSMCSVSCFHCTPMITILHHSITLFKFTDDIKSCGKNKKLDPLLTINNAEIVSWCDTHLFEIEGQSMHNQAHKDLIRDYWKLCQGKDCCSFAEQLRRASWFGNVTREEPIKGCTSNQMSLGVI